MPTIRIHPNSDFLKVGDGPGVYLVKSANGPFLRTGSTTTLRSRLSKHGRPSWGDNWTTKTGDWRSFWMAEFIDWPADKNFLTAVEGALHGWLATEFTPVSRSGLSMQVGDDRKVSDAVAEFQPHFQRIATRNISDVVFV